VGWCSACVVVQAAAEGLLGCFAGGGGCRAALLRASCVREAQPAWVRQWRAFRPGIAVCEQQGPRGRSPQVGPAGARRGGRRLVGGGRVRARGGCGGARPKKALQGEGRGAPMGMLPAQRGVITHQQLRPWVVQYAGALAGGARADARCAAPHSGLTQQFPLAHGACRRAAGAAACHCNRPRAGRPWWAIAAGIRECWAIAKGRAGQTPCRPSEHPI
jgi:hypothetical protein